MREWDEVPVNYAETIAKRVIEASLPGARMEYRSDQSHSEYDFVLHYPNRTIAAVEVTESADQLQKQTSAEIRNNKKGGPVIEAKKCQKSWIIFPMGKPNFSKIRRNVDAYLFSLEQSGIKRFSFFEAITSRRVREAGIEKFVGLSVPECVENICFDLQLNGGFVVDEGGTPKIFFGHPVRVGKPVPITAIKAAKREAFKDDNRNKRGAANAAERHLVVYVDKKNYFPWIALTEYEPPSALPEMPAEITHMWLIGPAGKANDNEFVVWRASARETWRSYRVVVPQTIPTSVH